MGLGQVEEQRRVVVQPVGLFKLRDGLIPFAKVEVLLALLVVLARLLRRIIGGARWRR